MGGMSSETPTTPEAGAGVQRDWQSTTLPHPYQARRSGCWQALLVAGLVGAGGLVALVVLVALLFGALIGACEGALDLDFPGCAESDERIVEAAYEGETAAVESELEQGTDPDQPDGSGRIALECAVQGGNVEITELLLEAGAEPTEDALDRAVGSRVIDLSNESRASDVQRRELTILLLEHGADPDGGPQGPSPLLFASWNGRADLVDLLLAHGADPDYGGRVSRFEILAARDGTFSDIAGPTQPDVPPGIVPSPQGDEVENVPPLVGAVWGGGTEIAATLLEAGADPDLAADEAFTAIFAAAVQGDRETVDLLRFYGADLTPEVRDGVATPAEAARAAGHKDIADLLDTAA